MGWVKKFMVDALYKAGWGWQERWEGASSWRTYTMVTHVNSIMTGSGGLLEHGCELWFTVQERPLKSVGGGSRDVSLRDAGLRSHSAGKRGFH